MPAFADLVVKLNDNVANSNSLMWHDVFSPVRDYMAVYDGKILLIPFDADFGQMLVRPDLVDSYAAETGQPAVLQDWDGVMKFVQHFDVCKHARM